MTETKIRLAVARALDATGKFDGVYLGAFAQVDGRSAEDRRAVAVEPMDSAVASAWDAGGAGEYVDCRVRITIIARDGDGERCDAIAQELLDAAKSTLLKAGLGGLVMPEFSRVGRWTWQRAKAPERRVEAVFQCRYLVD